MSVTENLATHACVYVCVKAEHLHVCEEPGYRYQLHALPLFMLPKHAQTRKLISAHGTL